MVLWKFNFIYLEMNYLIIGSNLKYEWNPMKYQRTANKYLSVCLLEFLNRTFPYNINTNKCFIYLWCKYENAFYYRQGYNRDINIYIYILQLFYYII